jgi:hypothetical protein
METDRVYLTDEGCELIKSLLVVAKANEDGEDDLVSGIKSLVAIARFLETTPWLVESGALRPLKRLCYALRDLAEGSKPPMLFNRTRRDGAPAGTSDDILRGSVAVALEILVRAGEEPGPASRFLARVMDSHRVRMRGGTPVRAKQIERWRKEMGSSASPIMPMLFKEVLAKLEKLGRIPEKGAKPTERQVKEARKYAANSIEGLWLSGF